MSSIEATFSRILDPTEASRECSELGDSALAAAFANWWSWDPTSLRRMMRSWIWCFCDSTRASSSASLVDCREAIEAQDTPEDREDDEESESAPEGCGPPDGCLDDGFVRCARLLFAWDHSRHEWDPAM